MNPLEFIKLIFSNRSYKDSLLKEVEKVEITPLPEDFKLPYDLEPKQCYKNSYNSVLMNQDLDYVEGYLFYGGKIPIEHAWVYDKTNDKYYDPTLNTKGNGDYYKLIRMTYTEILDMAIKEGVFGPWIHEYFKDKNKIDKK